MSEFLKTMRTSRGGFAMALLAMVLGVATYNCGQLKTAYPPVTDKETKLEAYVNNLTVPGAPKNTAYNWGEAEIIAHIQGTGSHVAFYIPWGIGWAHVWGSEFGFDATTGSPIYANQTSCLAEGFAVSCMAIDGWAYQKVDFQGHAKLRFWVGNHKGYYDLLARPAMLNGNGVIGQKLEFEERIRVFFSTDMWSIYE